MNEQYSVWCVEERAIKNLKARGHGRPKKHRRSIGRAIRYWQRLLRRGSKSFSVEVPPDLCRSIVLQKAARPLTITYELPQSYIRRKVEEYGRAQRRA